MNQCIGTIDGLLGKVILKYCVSLFLISLFNFSQSNQLITCVVKYQSRVLVTSPKLLSRPVDRQLSCMYSIHYLYWLILPTLKSLVHNMILYPIYSFSEYKNVLEYFKNTASARNLHHMSPISYLDQMPCCRTLPYIGQCLHSLIPSCFPMELSILFPPVLQCMANGIVSYSTF